MVVVVLSADHCDDDDDVGVEDEDVGGGAATTIGTSESGGKTQWMLDSQGYGATAPVSCSWRPTVVVVVVNSRSTRVLTPTCSEIHWVVCASLEAGSCISQSVNRSPW